MAKTTKQKPPRPRPTPKLKTRKGRSGAKFEIPDVSSDSNAGPGALVLIIGYTLAQYIMTRESVKAFLAKAWATTIDVTVIGVIVSVIVGFLLMEYFLKNRWNVYVGSVIFVAGLVGLVLTLKALLLQITVVGVVAAIGFAATMRRGGKEALDDWKGRQALQGA